jgi:spore coat protein JB
MSYSKNNMPTVNNGGTCAQNDMRRSSGGCRGAYPFGRAVRTPYGMERLGGWKNTCGQSRGTGGASCPWNARAEQTRTASEATRENGCGRGCGCGCNDHNTDCERLLAQIRAVDFALVEVVLYLDVYPDSCEALETYHKLIARRCALNEEYETACGPLTAMGNKSHTSWDWIDKPAPWEYNAN